MAIARKVWGAPAFDGPFDSKAKRELFIHHEAGPVRPAQSAAAERVIIRGIRNQHIRGNGWDDIGYSYVLFPSGRMYTGRGFRGLPAAQLNHNAGTVAICLAGHYDKQQISIAQKRRLIDAANNLHALGVRTVGGHRQVTQTACPGAKAYAWITPLAERTKLTRYHG